MVGVCPRGGGLSPWLTFGGAMEGRLCTLEALEVLEGRRCSLEVLVAPEAMQCARHGDGGGCNTSQLINRKGVKEVKEEDCDRK